MKNNYEEIKTVEKKGIHCQAFHKETLVDTDTVIKCNSVTDTSLIKYLGC